MRNPPVGCRLDAVQRQPGYIDELRRPLDILLHQIDEVGAARNEFRARMSRDSPHRAGNVGCAHIAEVDHDCAMSCWMAATMLG